MRSPGERGQQPLAIGPERPPAGLCRSSKVKGTEPRGPPAASVVRCEVWRLAHRCRHVQRTEVNPQMKIEEPVLTAGGRGRDASPSATATAERAEFWQGHVAFKGQGASWRQRWDRIRTNTLYPGPEVRSVGRRHRISWTTQVLGRPPDPPSQSLRLSGGSLSASLSLKKNLRIRSSAVS